MSCTISIYILFIGTRCINVNKRISFVVCGILYVQFHIIICMYNIYYCLYIILLYTMNKKLTVITIDNSRLLYSMILFCDVETNFTAITKERKKPWNKNYARNKIPIDEKISKIKNIKNRSRVLRLRPERNFYESNTRFDIFSQDTCRPAPKHIL